MVAVEYLNHPVLTLEQSDRRQQVTREDGFYHPGHL